MLKNPFTPSARARQKIVASRTVASAAGWRARSRATITVGLTLISIECFGRISIAEQWQIQKSVDGVEALGATDDMTEGLAFNAARLCREIKFLQLSRSEAFLFQRFEDYAPQFVHEIFGGRRGIRELYRNGRLTNETERIWIAKVELYF